ncbi:E3 ubiquitin-protein ligase COP1 [Bienertia sinuspersici]
MDEKAQGSYGPPRKDALSGLDSQTFSQLGLAVMRKKRIHVQVGLMTCKNVTCKSVGIDWPATQRGRERFNFYVERRLYRLRVIAKLRHEDPFHSANIDLTATISCLPQLEFPEELMFLTSPRSLTLNLHNDSQPCEEELTKGETSCNPLLDTICVVNEPAEAHCPVVEMSTCFY